MRKLARTGQSAKLSKMPGDACRSGNFDLLERTHIPNKQMFEYPKIHEIRSASDMVHPASTPENPITAAYVLVIRDRSPEGYIDDEFLDWNYILWWRRNDALNRELCLALRAETLVPDGEPQADDKFLEFRKDKLRFGDGKNIIRRSPDAPDLHEIGAAAEGFMAALVKFQQRYANSHKIFHNILFLREFRKFYG